LQRIRSTHVGHAVLNALRRSSGADLRSVVIFPCANPDDCQALPAEFEDAFGAGFMVRNMVGNRFQRPNRPNVGTGIGSHVTLYYSDRPVTFGGSFDGVLVHELMHSARMVQARQSRESIKFTRFTNFEEFIAILAENMYDSTRNRGLIRGAHNNAPDPTQTRHANLLRGILALQYEAAFPERERELSHMWATNFATVLQVLCRTEPNLAQQLGTISCRFNPLREYRHLTRSSSATRPG